MSARIALALIAVFSLGQAGPPLADIILHNGRFVTVDQGFSIAEAVAIANGRFTAVGGNDTIRRLASRSTRMIDLAGRTVVPGFIDNHLHSAGGGPGVDLSRARSIDDVLRAVFARIEQTEPGGIVVSNSDWHEAQLKEQRLPLRDDLDHDFEDSPGRAGSRRPRVHRQLGGTRTLEDRRAARRSRPADASRAIRMAGSTASWWMRPRV